MDERSKGAILSGYLVLDMTGARGRLVGKLLHDMGADVIRIESPSSPNIEDADFCYLHAGQRRVSLDIGGEAGREGFLKLVKQADFLVESFKPGYLASLGLGYADLSPVNSGLIMVSVTDNGQTGPHRDEFETDISSQAESGWLSVTGLPGEPMKLPGNQSWHTASLFAVNGLLLALRHRRQSGRGQYLDISIGECAAAVLDDVLIRQVYEGVTAGRQGSLHRSNAFRVFPCRDGHILLSIHREWDTLVEWLDSDGMADDLTDLNWRDSAVRNDNIGHIIRVLERWTRSHTAEELVATGQLMRFPWAKAVTIPEILDDPHLADRGFWVNLECLGETYRVPGPPVRMSGTPWCSGRQVADMTDGWETGL